MRACSGGENRSASHVFEILSIIGETVSSLLKKNGVDSYRLRYHAVHTCHAIFAATVAYMRKGASSTIRTSLFSKSKEPTISMIIHWQRCVSGYKTGVTVLAD